MTEKKISRRDAMKTLGAVVGAAALSSLPSKWNTPVVAASSLPAHAKQSAVSMPTKGAPKTVITCDADVSVALSAGKFTFGATVTPAAVYNLTYGGGTSQSAGDNLVLTAPSSGHVTTDATGRAVQEIDWTGGKTGSGDSIGCRFRDPISGVYCEQNITLI
jgi:hypothetical protein